MSLHTRGFARKLLKRATMSAARPTARPPDRQTLGLASSPCPPARQPAKQTAVSPSSPFANRAGRPPDRYTDWLTSRGGLP